MQIHCTDKNNLCMKENNMKKFELITEQIKSAYSMATTYNDASNKKMSLTLKVPPFGEVIINEDYHILINYSNPYLLDFKIYESFFKPRLKLEGYEAYIYQEKIVLYKRAFAASNDFESAITRANSFIQTIKCIEKFIEWNETLNR